MSLQMTSSDTVRKVQTNSSFHYLKLFYYHAKKEVIFFSVIKHQPRKEYGGDKMYPHAFLTSELDRGEHSHSKRFRFSEGRAIETT
jgi:hypothetical protein